MIVALPDSIKNRLEPMKWAIVRAYVGLIQGLPKRPEIFDWKKIGLLRTDVIKTISKVNNYSDYLEIGCQNDTNFAKVPFANKIGVDPNKGGTHRMTSDDFFAQNRIKDKKTFDVIFIDGLHEYEQVRKDAYNSLDFLNVGGIIVLHDMLPGSWEREYVPRLSRRWNGSTWKIAYELKQIFGNKFGIIVADEGLGVIFKDDPKKIEPLEENIFNEIRSKNYSDFLADYKNFNLVESSMTETFIRNRVFR